METDDLIGLPIGEGFRKYVLESNEVADLGWRLAEQDNNFSAVLIAGQTPDYTGYHWRLRAEPGDIAYQFVRSLGLVISDRPLPKPSELQAKVAHAMADRMHLLADSFAWGELTAVGTRAGTGIEGAIPRGEWLRPDLIIDVQNHSLYELQGNRRALLWTGVALRALPKPSSATRAETQKSESPKDFSKQTVQAETECVAWLEEVIGSSPDARTHTNAQLFEEARSKWGEKLGERAFERALAEAIRRQDAPNWKMGGRPRKTSAP